MCSRLLKKGGQSLLVLLLLASPLTASYDAALSQYYKGQYRTALKTLDTVQSRETPEKFVLSALCQLGLNQPRKGISALDKYMPQSGEAPYIAYIYGLLYLAEDDISKITDCDYFIQQSIIKPFLIKRLRLSLMQHHRQKKQWTAAETVQKRSLNNLQNPYIQSAVLKEKVKIEVGKDNRSQALRLYSQLLAFHPESDPGKKLWQLLQTTWGFQANFYTNFETIQDHLRFNQNALKTQQYDEVMKHHDYILRNFPEHPILYRFYFNKALALFHMGQYNLSVREFNRFVEPIMAKTDPDFLHMKFHSGLGLLYLGENDMALAQFEQVLSLGEGSPYYEKSLYHSLKLAENSNLQRYAPLIEKLETTYKNTAFYNQYYWEKNWKDLNEHSPPETEFILATMVEWPIKEKLVKWYKRYFPTLTQADANTRGIESFPISYKANQAILGLTELQPYTLVLNKSLSKKINRMVRLGLRPLLIEELTFDANREKTPKIDTIYHLARLYVESGNYQKGLSIISSGFESLNLSFTEVPQPFLRLMYPKLYWRSIQTYAKKYKVDPYLILALIRESSYFDTTQQSFNGKSGLLQLTPDTGKKVAFRLGQYWPGPKLLLQPKSNIKLGTFYTSWLEDQFGPNLHYILAALHAGPDTARLWAQSKREHYFTPFQESVPYMETRLFMQRVLDSYLIYKLVDDPDLQ